MFGDYERVCVGLVRVNLKAVEGVLRCRGGDVRSCIYLTTSRGLSYFPNWSWNWSISAMMEQIVYPFLRVSQQTSCRTSSIESSNGIWSQFQQNGKYHKVIRNHDGVFIISEVGEYLWYIQKKRGNLNLSALCSISYFEIFMEVSFSQRIPSSNLTSCTQNTEAHSSTGSQGV